VSPTKYERTFTYSVTRTLCELKFTDVNTTTLNVRF